MPPRTDLLDPRAVGADGGPRARAGRHLDAQDPLSDTCRVSVIVGIRSGLFRDGIVRLLGASRVIRVTCAVSDPRDLARVRRRVDADVLLLDGTFCGQAASDDLADARVVALVAEGDASVALSAPSAVIGYLTPDATPQELVQAVWAAAHGRPHYPPTLGRALLDGLAAGGETQAGRDALSPREREVGRLLAQGLPNKLIARELSVELSTVKNHVHSILAKLGVATRTQAARILAE